MPHDFLAGSQLVPRLSMKTSVSTPLPKRPSSPLLSMPFLSHDERPQADNLKGCQSVIMSFLGWGMEKLCLSKCTYIYMLYIYIYVCVMICAYAYNYTYIYTHICTHTNVCIYTTLLYVYIYTHYTYTYIDGWMDR